MPGLLDALHAANANLGSSHLRTLRPRGRGVPGLLFVRHVGPRETRADRTAPHLVYCVHGARVRLLVQGGDEIASSTLHPLARRWLESNSALPLGKLRRFHQLSDRFEN